MYTNGEGARPKKDHATSKFGCYMEDGKRVVDIVMVYEEEHEKRDDPDKEFDEHESRRRFFQNNLKKEGLELEIDQFQEDKKTMVVVKVHCPWVTLCNNAEELHIKTPLKVKDAPLKKKKGHSKKLWDKMVSKITRANVWGIKTNQASLMTTTTSTDVDKHVINWPFKKKHLERYAIEDRNTFFVQRQRIEIIWEILQQAQNDPDNAKKRGIESLLEHKIYETVFPLHDGDLSTTHSTPAPQWTARQKLKATWSSWGTIFQMQPLWDVRNYFGEKIGFYFAFMDSYTRWLTIPSFFGMIIFFFGLYYASDHPELHMICDAVHHAAPGGGGHGAPDVHGGETHGPDAQGGQTHAMDTHVGETHAHETHASDIHGGETHTPDAHGGNTHVPDTHGGVGETHASDIHGGDTHAPDTHGDATVTPDAHGGNTHVPDTHGGVGETHASDIHSGDTHAPDTHGDATVASDSHGAETNTPEPHNSHQRKKRQHEAVTESGHETVTIHGQSMANASMDDYKVANLWMCPICEPPHCDIWEMYEEGCSQYTWAFRLDNEASIILTCIVILWSIIFLKCWRRRESKLAVDWDTHDAEDHDMLIRPNYEERAPIQRKNPITLESEPYVPMIKRFRWLSASIMATIFLLIFATFSLLALVMSRIALYSQFKKLGGTFTAKNVEWARWTVHGMIFVTVTIFETFYHWVAHKLTEYECPKTENQFISSLLWKIFIFEMMNDFVPIAYAAWVKGKVPTPLKLDFLSELCDGGCVGEVTELVAVLLLARLVVGNTMEVGVPFLKHTFKEYIQQKKEDGEREHAMEGKRKPQYQNDFGLEEVELDGVYDEYMEMMIQFSFIVFFSSALPVAPFLCFLNNVVEIRVDAINMLQAHRRPVPIRVPGIQIWNSFMDIIIKLGIIINAGLIAFTSDNIPRMYYKYVVSPGHGYLGFTRFSLSQVPIHGWNERTTLMDDHLAETCYYPDFRYDQEPYTVTQIYYQILTIRVATFATFCMVFFIIMWFLNTFISDVPSDAKTKIQRRLYMVNKTLEAETVAGHAKYMAHRTKGLASRQTGDVIETNFH